MLKSICFLLIIFLIKNELIASYDFSNIELDGKIKDSGGSSDSVLFTNELISSIKGENSIRLHFNKKEFIKNKTLYNFIKNELINKEEIYIQIYADFRYSKNSKVCLFCILSEKTNTKPVDDCMKYDFAIIKENDYIKMIFKDPRNRGCFYNQRFARWKSDYEKETIQNILFSYDKNGKHLMINGEKVIDFYNQEYDDYVVNNWNDDFNFIINSEGNDGYVDIYKINVYDSKKTVKKNFEKFYGYNNNKEDCISQEKCLSKRNICDQKICNYTVNYISSYCEENDLVETYKICSQQKETIFGKPDLIYSVYESMILHYYQKDNCIVIQTSTLDNIFKYKKTFDYETETLVQIDIGNNTYSNIILHNTYKNTNGVCKEEEEIKLEIFLKRKKKNIKMKIKLFQDENLNIPLSKIIPNTYVYILPVIYENKYNNQTCSDIENEDITFNIKNIFIKNKEQDFSLMNVKTSLSRYFRCKTKLIIKTYIKKHYVTGINKIKLKIKGYIEPNNLKNRNHYAIKHFRKEIQDYIEKEMEIEIESYNYGYFIIVILFSFFFVISVFLFFVCMVLTRMSNNKYKEYKLINNKVNLDVYSFLFLFPLFFFFIKSSTFFFISETSFFFL